MWHSWISCTPEDILCAVLDIQQVIHNQETPAFPVGFLQGWESKMALAKDEPVISFLYYTCGTKVLPPL